MIGRAAKGGLKLRPWTRGKLCRDDYAFAISDDLKQWECLASKLWSSSDTEAQRIVRDMLTWELFRELDSSKLPECRRGAYMSVPEHNVRIEAAVEKLSRAGNKSNLAADIPLSVLPLVEIPLCEAEKFEQIRRDIDQGISIHALEISRDERTDDTVRRFRKWLTDFKKTPDSRRFVAEMKKDAARQGGLKLDATLRALSVRRLKLAGFSREEAESRLCLRRYFLNPSLRGGEAENRWQELPARADSAIRRFLESARHYLEVVRS